MFKKVKAENTEIHKLTHHNSTDREKPLAVVREKRLIT